MRHLKKDSAFSAFFAILDNSLEKTRRCGRAVECTGLENRRRLIADREFESHRLRQENGSKYLIFRAFLWSPLAMPAFYIAVRPGERRMLRRPVKRLALSLAIGAAASAKELVGQDAAKLRTPPQRM